MTALRSRPPSISPRSNRDGEAWSTRLFDLPPALPQRLAICGEPVEREQGDRVRNGAGFEHCQRGGSGLEDDPDLLMLLGDAVKTAGAAGVDPAAEQLDGLRRAARARQESANRDEIADQDETGLLIDLASRNRNRILLAVDQPGDDLDLPGGKACEMGGEAKAARSARPRRDLGRRAGPRRRWAAR
jgi:hypothetical protein